MKNVVADLLSCPAPQLTGSVAAAAADPVDYEEMAAKPNRCAETQRLLGGTSLKGTVAGDFLLRVFCNKAFIRVPKNTRHNDSPQIFIFT